MRPTAPAFDREVQAVAWSRLFVWEGAKAIWIPARFRSRERYLRQLPIAARRWERASCCVAGEPERSRADFFERPLPNEVPLLKLLSRLAMWL
jgi:hypothetical protein